jgi:uncharacterized protein YcsI (UPF0317 family)
MSKDESYAQVNFVFVFFIKESACTCWPDRALFRARLMSIFAISDKLSLESTGGISRGFMQDGLMAIPASLTHDTVTIKFISKTQRKLNLILQ